MVNFVVIYYWVSEMDKKNEKFDRNKIKKKGIKRFFNSFINSFNGLKYAYLYEQSFLLHAILVIVVLITGFYFHISKMQWAILLIVLAMVMITELINTAIEAVVDLVTDEYHELAKIAKDCGSAATFVSSILAVGLYVYVFLPQIVILILGK